MLDGFMNGVQTCGIPVTLKINFFFFQAEDGIRDWSVTGVQTCALPIMASVNKVILVGNLGRDPETRYNPEGGAITNISIATTDTWKDKASGEKQERTEWHRVVFFSRLAEIAGEYLKKGSQVYVEGSLRTRKWQDKEGK